MSKKKRKVVRKTRKSTKRKTASRRPTKRVTKRKTAKRTTKRKPAKRKATKRKTHRSSSRIESHHTVLREALRDIARELGQLREEKSDLEVTLDDVAGDLTAAQNQEVSLKDQLRKLGSVENSLTLRRGRMRKKLESVKQKISKVRQLSNQMENI